MDTKDVPERMNVLPELDLSEPPRAPIDGPS
jgi:hypothetical protein